MRTANEKPLLMKPDMVLATLGGYKTMTRRTRGLEDVNKAPGQWKFTKTADLDWMTKPQYRGRFGAYFESETIEPRTLSICPQVYPYGRVGGRLWVKETFRPADYLVEGFNRENPYYVQYRADALVGSVLPGGIVIYPEWSKGWSTDKCFGNWQPSIFMPRWASRILLEITGVHLERVQDITVIDIDQEGVREVVKEGMADKPTEVSGVSQNFIELWDGINKRRGLGWDFNPWIWVTTFKVLSTGAIRKMEF